MNKIMNSKAPTYLEDLFRPKEIVNQIELRDSINKLAVQPCPKQIVTNNLLATVARFFGITWPHLKE